MERLLVVRFIRKSLRRPTPVSSLILLLLLPCVVFAQDISDLRQRAEKGDAEAQAHLGRMYYLGKGVPTDDNEAAKWFGLAAEQGNTGGQWGLGVCYLLGRGKPKDYSEALKWFHKGAEKHNAMCQFYIGMIHFDGMGVPQNREEGVKWFRKSAQQGFLGAQKVMKELGLSWEQ
jgi:uncharacterized protein